MNIKYKVLNELAKVPTRGSEYAAGYDLYAATDEPMNILAHTTQLVKTGLAFELPDGYFGAIFARSGLASKKGLRPANCVGVVDSDYRGEVMVALHNDTDNDVAIDANERIAQLVLIPYVNMTFEEAEELDATTRGEGGFGSTGSK
jgi:dUTP pyrophosphatase